MEATIPEETAGQLDQAQVVPVLLLISHQDATALRQPGERPLHDPSPRLLPLRSVARLLLLTDPPDVCDVTPSGRRFTTLRVVRGLVQGQVLFHLGRIGPLDDDRLDRLPQELLFDDV